MTLGSVGGVPVRNFAYRVGVVNASVLLSTTYQFDQDPSCRIWRSRVDVAMPLDPHDITGPESASKWKRSVTMSSLLRLHATPGRLTPSTNIEEAARLVDQVGKSVQTADELLTYHAVCAIRAAATVFPSFCNASTART
jgi:hypothetical protein